MGTDIRKHADEDGYCYWIIRALISPNYNYVHHRALRRTNISSLQEEFYCFRDNFWYEQTPGDNIHNWSSAYIISKEEAIIYSLTKKPPITIKHMLFR